MEINRRIAGYRSLEDRPELGIVEEFAVGMGVDDDAAEFQGLDRPLDLARGRLRVLRRHCGKSGETCRVPRNRSGQRVVGDNRHVGPNIGVERLHAGAGDRQQMRVDLEAVHFVDTEIEIGQLPDHLGPTVKYLEIARARSVRAFCVAEEFLDVFDRGKSLFGGDQAHGSILLSRAVNCSTLRRDSIPARSQATDTLR